MYLPDPQEFCNCSYHVMITICRYHIISRHVNILRLLPSRQQHGIDDHHHADVFKVDHYSPDRRKTGSMMNSGVELMLIHESEDNIREDLR